MRKIKILSYLTLIVILVYGFSKHWLSHFYTTLVLNVLASFGISELEFIDYVAQFRGTTEWKGEITGWVIYYPTYVSLHVIYITLHFWYQRKTRIILSSSLIITLVTLFSIGILAHKMEWENIYQFVLKPIKTIFNVPFLLFVLEGGRTLLNDINQRLNQN